MNPLVFFNPKSMLSLQPTIGSAEDPGDGRALGWTVGDLVIILTAEADLLTTVTRNWDMSKLPQLHWRILPVLHACAISCAALAPIKAWRNAASLESIRKQRHKTTRLPIKHL